jgi:hypothetical protein
VNPNLNPSKRADVVGSIDPDAYAAGTYTTGWIDMSKFFSVLAVVMAGTLGASATLDAKIQQARIRAARARRISPASRSRSLRRPAPIATNRRSSTSCSRISTANNFARPPLDDGRDGGVRRRRVVLGFDPRFGDAEANDKASVDEIVS